MTNTQTTVTSSPEANEEFDFHKYYFDYLTNACMNSKVQQSFDLFASLYQNASWKLWKEEDYDDQKNVIAATFFSKKLFGIPPTSKSTSFGKLHNFFSGKKINYKRFFELLHLNNGIFHYEEMKENVHDDSRYIEPNKFIGQMIFSFDIKETTSSVLAFISINEYNTILDVYYPLYHHESTDSKSLKESLIEMISEFESNAFTKPIKFHEKKKASLYSVVDKGTGYTLIDMSFEARENLHKENFDKYKKINYPYVNHEKLYKFVSETNVKDLPGKLLLLHGLPGTGKTTYIRHLISERVNPQTKVVLMSTSSMARLSSPDFIMFAMGNLKNSILLVEEAEKLIVSREDTKGESPISDLLNITDGLLGDALNIRVIATFNTGSTNIDKALKREGRLYHMQDFPLHNERQAKNFLYANSEYYRKYEYDETSLWEQFFKEQQAKEGSVCIDDNNLGKQISLSDLYSIVNRLEKKV